MDTLFTIAALKIAILMGLLLSPATAPNDHDQMMTKTTSAPKRKVSRNVPLQLLGELAKQQTRLIQKLQSEYADYMTLLFNKLVTSNIFILKSDYRKHMSKRIVNKNIQVAITITVTITITITTQ